MRSDSSEVKSDSFMSKELNILCCQLLSYQVSFQLLLQVLMLLRQLIAYSIVGPDALKAFIVGCGKGS